MSRTKILNSHFFGNLFIISFSSIIMKRSTKLAAVSIIFFILGALFVFTDTLLGLIFLVLFLVFIIAASIATVHERGGFRAWRSRRIEDQRQYDANKREHREFEKMSEMKGYYEEKGKIKAQRENKRWP